MEQNLFDLGLYIWTKKSIYKIFKNDRKWVVRVYPIISIRELLKFK